VCIDDFALCKRMDYGTIMIDSLSHKVIDMIHSRSTEDVAEWLKLFPHLILVSRDGATLYKNAVTEANPDIHQISDRFHLLKNLTDYAKKAIQAVVPSKVILAPPENAIEVPVDKAIEHYTASDKQKTIRVEEVRELAHQGMSQRQISRYCHISRPAVKKYLDPTFTIKQPSQRHVRLLDPFRTKVYEGIKEGHTIAQINDELKKHGYRGSQRTVGEYVRKLKEEQIHQKDSYSVSRHALIQLLYQKESKISLENLAIIFELYPKLPVIIETVKQFSFCLLKGHSISLCYWLSEVKNYEIPQFNSFIKGVLKDLTAVLNSTIYPYNNGLAEGHINKLKLIKRIMYGRANFETLKNKVLWNSFN
jgi:transposase